MLPKMNTTRRNTKKRHKLNQAEHKLSSAEFLIVGFLTRLKKYQVGLLNKGDLMEFNVSIVIRDGSCHNYNHINTSVG